MKKTTLFLFVCIIANLVSAAYFYQQGTIEVSGLWGNLASAVIGISASLFPIIIMIGLDMGNKTRAVGND
ncbi:hypothetical protein [Pantoea dispersa]|uniref:hypothetical protein n=1 Tax=Pantoea dispersa TaxID=59814 RepID=UPI000F65CD90|nr:hypothetical protein [Pantoea dispersa]